MSLPGELAPKSFGLNLFAIVIAGPLSVRGKNRSAFAFNEVPFKDCLVLFGNVIASGFSFPFQYCLSILYTAPGKEGYRYFIRGYRRLDSVDERVLDISIA